MKKEMLINVRQSEECRIAIIEDGVLEELYVDRTSHETYSGNIYKGRIVNLEPAIQAAFVDFSIGRNGFLHVSDVEPRYYSKHLGDDIQLGGRDRGRDPRRVLPGGVPMLDEGPSVDRPPRSERGPRRGRDERRGGRSAGREIAGRELAPEGRVFEPAAEFTGDPEFDIPLDSGGEQVVDMSASDMTTRRGPRPDGRRDRSRRGGSGRSRSGRGNRDQRAEPSETAEERPFDLDSAAPAEERFPPVQPFADQQTVEPPAPSYDKPDFGSELEETSGPVAEIDAPSIAPAWEPPPVPPPRPSFVTRVRRAFGSGLEDWETPDPAPASKVRQVLSPISAPVPVVPPTTPTQPESKVEEAENRTVTRSISPAVTERTADPAPQAVITPRPAKRRGFGSGLLDEPDEPEAIEQTPSAEPPSPVETIVAEYREETVSKVQAVATQEALSEAEDAIAQFSPDEIFGESPIATPESSETWSEFSVPESAAEGDEADAGVTDRPPPRSRGRRRSGTSGRNRSRTRRNTDEPAAEAEFPVEEGVSGPPDYAEDFRTSWPESAETGESEGVDPQVPRGRDAIRARGGNRVSRGPRPPIHPRNLDSESEIGEAPPAAPVSPPRGTGRYVPRLEREKYRSGGYEDIGEASAVEFSDSGDRTGGDAGDLDSMGMDPDSEATLGDDPRINPRGRDGRSRRRRRRRRPGSSESVSRPEPAGNETSESADGANESASWNELDWSSSPPGAAEALAGVNPEFDTEAKDRPEPQRPPGRQRKRGRRQPPVSAMGPAPGDPLADDSDDDFLEPSGRGYTFDPEDIVEPELEEEIRREAEEIAGLEIELGIRQPGEIRESPRSGGAQGGRSAAGGRGFFKPPIQEIFRRNDEVLIQVIKESLGTKGPTLSTYISIPGRYLVLMPGLNRVGVSRKIADDNQRRKLRDLMNQLNPPKGLGFIVRTAGVDRSKRDLARDLAYLLRLWKTILRRIKRTKSPAPIYQESDMIIRTIRDIFNSEIDTIWIDEASAYERAHEFLNNVMPKFADRLKLYEDKTPLFHKYGIEDEIAKIGMRHVPLPDGGSIVIDQTEALVAIDVNSGNFRVEDDAERTAYEMNLRAAKEIARQLRLRDLGGVIVNDFIDMREERHRRGVERALRDAIRRDRARTKILRMSQFGLIEMTRQRIRPSIKRSIYEDCPHCIGQGVVKTPESMSIDVMRILALAANRNDLRRINITCSHNVANYLNNRKRQELARLEKDGHMSIHIRPEDHVPAEFLQIDGLGNYNTEFRLYPTAALTPGRRLPNTTGNAPALPYNPQHMGGHHGHFH